MAEGGWDCSEFCPVCAGDGVVTASDFWGLLDYAPEWASETRDLWAWAAHETKGHETIRAWFDLTGVSSEMGRWYQFQMRPLGQVECDLLAKALTEYANRPTDIGGWAVAMWKAWQK